MGQEHNTAPAMKDLQDIQIYDAALNYRESEKRYLEDSQSMTYSP